MIDEAHIFNNRYRLDGKLGEGGMATVYCGTDTLLRRRVAIKVLREQYASDEEFVRRFYQEAESAARLSHPNIVNTYDVGREGNTYYIVMELVDGPSLAEIIASDGKLPEPVAIDYAAQICNGLAYAHRQGLLHRDIKPANILITKDDVVKLSDFGIARAMSQQTMAMTRPGLIMGSVYYLSPEQAQGHGAARDLGLVQCRRRALSDADGAAAVHGRFTGNRGAQTCFRSGPDHRSGRDGISPALAAIVNKLLQKRPDHRFQSASEVASALREARERPAVPAFSMQDDSPTQPIQGPLAPPPRPSRLPDRQTLVEERERRPRSLGPFIILVVAALVIAAAAGYFATRPGVPRVTLDNYVGMTDVQASQALVNGGLVPKITRQTSDTVAPNRVISQDPAPSTQIPKGNAVSLVVSSGKPTLTLQNFLSYTVADAQNDLTNLKFRTKIERKFDPAQKDTVIEQTPKAGTTLREGSMVTLVVSNGPAPTKMPRLVGLTLDKARAIAAKDAFTINIAETASFNNIPPNVIQSQDVTTGTTIPSDHSVTVNVVVSTGGGLAQVPSVVNQNYVSANSALTKAGFTVKVNPIVHPASADNGLVIQEDPAGGTPLERGNEVTISLSIPGEVPDTEGMALQDAENTLLNAGYTVGNITPTTEGADGKVVRTEPFAGTKLNPNTPVNIYINSASAQPSQP